MSKSFPNYLVTVEEIIEVEESFWAKILLNIKATWHNDEPLKEMLEGNVGSLTTFNPKYSAMCEKFPLFVLYDHIAKIIEYLSTLFSAYYYDRNYVMNKYLPNLTEYLGQATDLSQPFHFLYLQIKYVDKNFKISSVLIKKTFVSFDTTGSSPPPDKPPIWREPFTLINYLFQFEDKFY